MIGLSTLMVACAARQEPAPVVTASVSDEDFVSQMPQLAYTGPKARMHVRQFGDKSNASWFSAGIAQSMADQLMLALAATGRYLTQKPGRGAEALGVGAGTPKSYQQHLGNDGEALIVRAVVTPPSDVSDSHSPPAKADHAVARIDVELSVIDATSGVVVANERLSSISSPPYTGRRQLVGRLNAWRDTTRGDAFLRLVDSAIEYISNHVPLRYYRYDHDGTLSFNARIGGGFSDAVVEAQSALTALGYEPGPIDGHLGRETQQALQAFRKDRGIDRVGRLDIETLRELRMRLKRQK